MPDTPAAQGGDALRAALDAVYMQLKDGDTIGAALAMEGVLKGIDALSAPAQAVAVPTNADQAALMVLLGTAWLQQHAPERLIEAGHAQAVAVEPVIAALAWYQEQARLCRLIHSGGDAGRHALAADGGAKAQAAISAYRTHPQPAAKGADDSALLDWLDAQNARKNAHIGTVYGWQLNENHNRIALEDHGYPARDVRTAIRMSMASQAERAAHGADSAGGA